MYATYSFVLPPRGESKESPLGYLMGAEELAWLKRTFPDLSIWGDNGGNGGNNNILRPSFEQARDFLGALEEFHRVNLAEPDPTGAIFTLDPRRSIEQLIQFFGEAVVDQTDLFDQERFEPQPTAS